VGGNATACGSATPILIEVDQPQIADPAHPNTLVTPVTKYTYDANGDELTQTDANNHTTTFTYDALGDELTRTLPAGESESFTYDSFGREATHTDFDGNVATYHYDSLGREDQVTYTGASGSGKATQTVTYTYDDLGRQHSVTDASGTTTYSYDSDGNEIEADTPEGNIHYVYNNLDQHTETYTDNTDIVYGYDTQGRLTTTTVKKLNGNSVNLVTTDNYDAVGNKISEVLPNGVETDYTYDDLNRLTDVVEKKGTTTLFSQHYVLNDDGTRASDTETELQSDGSTETISSTWSYDALDRLTGETVTNSVSSQSFSDSYTYDLVGNRLTKTHTGPGGGANESIAYTYNGDDELMTQVSSISGETDFAYDANGSQTNDGNHKYVYDVRNKLAQVTDESNNVIVSYVYDDAGNRVRETTGGVTTFYLTDSNNPTGYAQPLEQKSSATALPTITYVIGDRILAQANATGGMTYLLTDGGGSTRLLSSSSGAVISTLNYAAFGEAINFDPTTIGTMFQFGGDSMYDLASGLNFHGSGRQSSDYRFISRDDPGYTDNFNPLTLNLTLLDNADAVNVRDPSGHEGLVDMLVTAGIAMRLTAGAIFGVAGAINLANAGLEVQRAYVASTEGSLNATFEIIGHTALAILDTYTGIVNIQIANTLLFGAPTPPIPPGGMAILRAAVAAAGDNPALIGEAVLALSPAIANDIVSVAGVFLAANNLVHMSLGSGGSESMFGQNGTQFISKTVWQGDEGRIDVENPAPGSRPGQIHFQDAKGNKYLFDPYTRQFKNAPNSVNNLLENESVQNAIQKALKYLGETP
jgi:YD repeat-containing protein